MDTAFTSWELLLRPPELVAGVSGSGSLNVRLSDFHAEPGVLVVDGSSADWDELAGALDTAGRRRLLRSMLGLAAVSIAVVRGAPPTSARDLVAAFDLRAVVGSTRPVALPVNLVSDERQVDGAVGRWRSGIARSPAAALVGAMVARTARTSSVESALVHESLGYALLRGSQAHQRWLLHRDTVADVHDLGATVTVADVGTHTEVVLQRPERHNAFNARMRDELYEVLTALALGDTATIVLRGAGPSFCSGGDLAEFGVVPTAMRGHLTRLGRTPARLLHELRERTIVGLHGVCAGAGIELAAYSERVLAAEDVTIWLPEADMGLLPGAGGTVSITRRAGSHRLVELLVTGDRIDAMTARSWGLVDEVVPRPDLEAALRRDARSREPVQG